MRHAAAVGSLARVLTHLILDSQHFEGLKSSPSTKFGGGMLAAHPKPGEALQLYGSTLTVEADTREEVIAILEKDIYARSGVWNVGIAQILPVSRPRSVCCTVVTDSVQFKTGAREAL